MEFIVGFIVGLLYGLGGFVAISLADAKVYTWIGRYVGECMPCAWLVLLFWPVMALASLVLRRRAPRNPYDCERYRDEDWW